MTRFGRVHKTLISYRFISNELPVISLESAAPHTPQPIPFPMRYPGGRLCVGAILDTSDSAGFAIYPAAIDSSSLSLIYWLGSSLRPLETSEDIPMAESEGRTRNPDTGIASKTKPRQSHQKIPLQNHGPITAYMAVWALARFLP